MAGFAVAPVADTLTLPLALSAEQARTALMQLRASGVNLIAGCTSPQARAALVSAWSDLDYPVAALMLINGSLSEPDRPPPSRDRRVLASWHPVSVCRAGTDCTDCGVRLALPPATPHRRLASLECPHPRIRSSVAVWESPLVLLIAVTLLAAACWHVRGWMTRSLEAHNAEKAAAEWRRFHMATL